MHILIVSMSLLLFLLAGTAYAQEKTKTYPKYILSTKPLLIFDGEYKINFEMPFKSPHDWVGIGISGFYLPEKEEENCLTSTSERFPARKSPTDESQLFFYPYKRN